MSHQEFASPVEQVLRGYAAAASAVDVERPRHLVLVELSAGSEREPASEPEPEQKVLDRITGLAAARSAIEADLLVSTRALVATVGDELLRDKGFGDVEELTAGQRRRWRAEAKRLSCAELEVALGVGVKEARQLVGVACSPVPVRDHVEGALRRGTITWGHVKGFWDRCGRLPADEAGQVAEGLFGTDAATVVAERLGPDGTVRDHPWSSAHYWAALEREAVRVEGTDVVADRERRRLARERRSASLRVDDDSTATLFVNGPVTSLAAISTRLDRCARTLRKGGDPRTLPQLRSDVAQTLLLHGRLPLPDLGDDDLVTPADAATIAQVVTAQPAVHLQVVVPWDAVTGMPSCHRCRDGTAADPRVVVGGTAEVLGANPTFLTPGHARELALTPRTTLSRILVDPADGRLVERSIAGYRPDAAMRRQIVAADVHSRAPGRRTSSARCEIDHETAWGAGGPTSEPNLSLKDVAHHQFKTEGWWSSELAPNRDVTWETLLGQVTSTRCHDYRQYLRRAVATDSVGDTGTESDDIDTQGVHGAEDDRRRRDAELDLACRTLYAALAHRSPHGLLTDPDDLHGATDHDEACTGWIRLSHRSRDGQALPGPRDDQATPARLLGLLRLPEGETPDPNPDPDPAPDPRPDLDDPPPF